MQSLTRSLWTASATLAARAQVQTHSRSFANLGNYASGDGRKRATLIPGDGIGPEIAASVVGVFQAAEVPLDWDVFENVKGVSPSIPQEVIASISRNGVALKGPFYTPVLTESYSRNSELRKALDLYAHVIPIKSFPGVKTRHDGVPIDIVVVRENTQGEYSGLEQQLVPGLVQSLKIITREESLRIARFAFEFAKNEGRNKVTAIHKANIQKLTDGLFLECCTEVAKEYPSISFNNMIIDNCCMQLVMRPEQFDVMVTPNLYGNLVTNIAAALIGGPGLVPGANVGPHTSVFEMGAHHVAADIAGQDKANPTGLLLSGVLLLRHMGFTEQAARIDAAVKAVVQNRVAPTADIGGTATTKEFTKAVIDRVERQ